MSLPIKLIIPLCKTVIPRRFLTKEAGFVDAFTIDSDRAYLREHIILMYEFSVNSAEKAIRFETLRRNKIPFYTKKINGKTYTIYCINAATPEICNYRIWNSSPKSRNALKRIINYWKSDDEEVTDYILGYKNRLAPFEDSFCPEMDINESDNEEGVTIQQKHVYQK